MSWSAVAVPQWAVDACSSALRPAAPAESSVPSTSNRSTVGYTRGLTRLPEDPGRYASLVVESIVALSRRLSPRRSAGARASQPELASDDDELDLARALGDRHEPGVAP